MASIGAPPSDRHHVSCQLLSVVVAGQRFGIAIDSVRDILGPQQMTVVPLAAPEIAGVLNLRGRVVTVIDLRRRLGLGAGDNAASRRPMHIVVDHAGELYSLLVDHVGEVLALDCDRLEAETIGLPQQWRPLARGIVRLDEALLVELDVERTLALEAVG